MRTWRMAALSLLLASAALAQSMAGGVGAAVLAQHYSASDLGGRSPASAFDLNAPGRIVGSITPADQARAALWPRAGETPIELPMLAGTNWTGPAEPPIDLGSVSGGIAFARAINAAGQIVGDEGPSSAARPLVWKRSP